MTQSNDINLDKINISKNASQVDKRINVDELLEKEVGAYGLWQWSVTLLFAFSTASPITFAVFGDSLAPHRCRLNDAIELFIENSNYSFNYIASIVGPWNNQINYKIGCERYKFNWSVELIDNLTTNGITQLGNLSQLPTELCDHGYVFEESLFYYPGGNAKEFFTFCQHAWLTPLASSGYVLGMLCGFIISGMFSDRIGRKRTVIILSVIDILANIGTSLAPNYTIFFITRFITGFGNSGKVGVCNILILELTVARYRSGYTALLQVGLNFFNRSMMTLWAFLLPNWRWLNIVMSYPTVFSILYFCFIPESPRWLIAKKRHLEALYVLRKGAKINHLRNNTQQFSKLDNLIDLYENKEKDCDKLFNKDTEVIETLDFNSNFSLEYFDATKSFVYIKTAIFACMFCFGILASFFGLLLYARVVWSNLYLNVFYNALTSLPATVIFYLIYRFTTNRKCSLSIVVLLLIVTLASGGLYSIIWKPKNDIVLQVSSNIGLCLANIALGMCFVYIPELFPSHIRNQRFGLVLGFARIGAVLSSFINELDTIVLHGFPLVIYSCLLCFGCLFLYGIPNPKSRTPNLA